MELRALWKIVKRRWWLIALTGLAALALAVYTYISTPTGGGSFATSIRFTAATPPSSDRPTYEDSSYYPWLASEYVVNALTDWVQTSSFTEEVSLELGRQGIEIPAGALQASISADNARSVMVLYMNWHDAGQLEAIAGAVAVVLQERSTTYFPQLDVVGVDVVALDEPAIGAVPPPLSARLEPLVRFALGLAAGFALAFLVEYLDPTVHERAELEALGLAVLSEVPAGRRRR